MKTRRLFYGWLDHASGQYMVSLYPADAPVRPSIVFETLDEVAAMVKRRRAEIMWWPPLPEAAR